jgi:hypothetical protein
VDAGAVPEPHPRPDEGKCADLDPMAELGARLNDGGGMDAGGHGGRNQKAEIRNQKSEVRSQEPEGSSGSLPTDSD